MLSFEQIQKAYTSDLQPFKRGIFREYLQYQILAIIFSHPLGRKLSFLGGTCLRIVHNLERFSEDIDFDNKDLSAEEFTTLSLYIQKELEERGFEVEIKMITKQAFHCYIKFPELLYKQGLSPIAEEKVLVQIDTFDQKVLYTPEIFILDKFNFFKQIAVTPKAVLLSQKLWTITQRKRFKGRDFFDAMFLLQNTKPDTQFLSAKFGSSEYSLVKNEIMQSIAGVDWDAVVADVRPFIFKSEAAENIRLFPRFLEQVTW